MKLVRIDEAIDACRNHLGVTGASGTSIEAFLTSYLMILIYASFEEQIVTIISDRAGRSKDTGLAHFVHSSVRQVLRSMKTSEIAVLLGRFGEDHKHQFQIAMKENERAETFFNNIVVQRHDTAHKHGSNLTLEELVQFYDEGCTVLDAIKAALD